MRKTHRGFLFWSAHQNKNRREFSRGDSNNLFLLKLDYIFAFASAAATSFELMSRVIMNPLVPLNSNDLSPAR